MKRATLHFAALLSALMAGCVTTPDPYDTKKPSYLVPFATPADAPAQVRYIVPESPAKSAFEIGDVLLSVDDKPVLNTWGFYSLLSPNAKTVRVRAKDGDERTVPVSKLIKSGSYEMWAWLLEPGQTLSFNRLLKYSPFWAQC